MGERPADRALLNPASVPTRSGCLRAQAVDALAGLSGVFSPAPCGSQEELKQLAALKVRTCILSVCVCVVCLCAYVRARVCACMCMCVLETCLPSRAPCEPL